MAKKTLDEFWGQVARTQAACPDWRWGQTAFNVLCVERPELAEAVRGERYDPFYAREKDNDRLVRFIEYLEGAWNAP